MVWTTVCTYGDGALPFVPLLLGKKGLFETLWDEDFSVDLGAESRMLQLQSR